LLFSFQPRRFVCGIGVFVHRFAVFAFVMFDFAHQPGVFQFKPFALLVSVTGDNPHAEQERGGNEQNQEKYVRRKHNGGRVCKFCHDFVLRSFLQSLNTAT